MRQPVHEAEVAAVGAAPDPGRLERDAHGFVQRTLDLELDLLAVRLPDVEHELFVGGEEFPVEKVLDLPAVDRDDLGAGFEPQLLGDRVRVDGGDLDHRGGNLAAQAPKSKSTNYFR